VRGQTEGTFGLVNNGFSIEDILMRDEPKKLPTYEDAVEKLGLDAMSFFSDMVRPDQHEEREEDSKLAPTAQTPPEHTPEEARSIIEGLEKYFGRKPTHQEINLALEEARWF
jgi:hypothetical protein